ncbi:hypothetical protein IB286_02810 [Spongiibacter sp. KMU-158]|uniref:TIGR02001 family outer membrane protein n=1 Tax=Spongiibacter pelagi TaxID=2760804 RepID=A0A927BYJ0_9GAMM|nr:TorF family putative porin [Spongiibacter pelagi]MBD2857923.1 hypothetical protein [Spongiibacter pelagi]
MNSAKKILGLAILATAPAMASAVEVSGNVTLASDYTFRGQSQTNERGAIQGGFDADFGNGFTLGAWSSNVDGGAGTENTQELDLYAGYSFAVSEGVSLDLGYTHYIYPGKEVESNYDEFLVGVSFAGASLSVIYSPEYFGSDNGSAVITNLDYSMAVNEAVSIDYHIGYIDGAEDGIVDSDSQYVDYKIGVNYGVGGVTLGLAYVGTDTDSNADILDDRMVLSISKSL